MYLSILLSTNKMKTKMDKIDWYLTVRDNEWCESMSGQQQATSSGSNSVVPNNSNSERLQQLASEQNLSYATRMVLPANHKLSPVSLDNGTPTTIQNAIHQKGSLTNSQVSSGSQLVSSGGLETNNIIITATALSDSSQPLARAAGAKAAK